MCTKSTTRNTYQHHHEIIYSLRICVGNVEQFNDKGTLQRNEFYRIQQQRPNPFHDFFILLSTSYIISSQLYTHVTKSISGFIYENVSNSSQHPTNAKQPHKMIIIGMQSPPKYCTQIIIIKRNQDTLSLSSAVTLVSINSLQNRYYRSEDFQISNTPPILSNTIRIELCSITNLYYSQKVSRQQFSTKRIVNTHLPPPPVNTRKKSRQCPYSTSLICLLSYKSFHLDSLIFENQQQKACLIFWSHFQQQFGHISQRQSLRVQVQSTCYCTTNRTKITNASTKRKTTIGVQQQQRQSQIYYRVNPWADPGYEGLLEKGRELALRGNMWNLFTNSTYLVLYWLSSTYCPKFCLFRVFHGQKVPKITNSTKQIQEGMTQHF
eukprot:TRINITY_DN7144_c1_g1_i2.p1 TRINITY_DN7144_c1_g1~~TRINITY_DN7144_c1_g1_i2.p1  ORF type:complete len:379 (-),score=-18.47 TRINITY_DN7144_c1_g1_i2:1446-2582(-)